jgi:PAS domain S-box-containing protein
MTKSTPNDNEIILDSKKYIVSQTNPQGIIEYANDYFIKISKYSESEIIGQAHNLIRHPDMPKIIFKMMWDRIGKGQNILALVKNLAKDGSYYWVITEFEPKIDKKTKQILSYTAFRQAAPRTAIDTIIPLYKKLVSIENSEDMQASQKYFSEFLDKKGMTYNEYIDDIIQNKGMFKLFFKAMKKMLAQ